MRTHRAGVDEDLKGVLSQAKRVLCKLKLTEQGLMKSWKVSSSSNFFLVSRWSKSCSSRDTRSLVTGSQVNLSLVVLKLPSRCSSPVRPVTSPDAPRSMPYSIHP